MSPVTLPVPILMVAPLETETVVAARVALETTGEQENALTHLAYSAISRVEPEARVTADKELVDAMLAPPVLNS